MTDEVREYAERIIWESGIRMVPGHYPDFESREHVDFWLEMMLTASKRHFGKIPMTELTTIDIDHYKDLLWKLKKNEDNLPREQLKQKYKKPYESLRREILDLTNKLIQEMILPVLWIRNDEKDGQFTQINTCIASSGIMKKIQEAVFENKCYWMIEREIRALVELISEQLEGEMESK